MIVLGIHTKSVVTMKCLDGLHLFRTSVFLHPPDSFRDIHGLLEVDSKTHHHEILCITGIRMVNKELLAVVFITNATVTKEDLLILLLDNQLEVFLVAFFDIIHLDLGHINRDLFLGAAFGASNIKCFFATIGVGPDIADDVIPIMQ
jgi:hypothetical protein